MIDFNKCTPVLNKPNSNVQKFQTVNSVFVHTADAGLVNEFIAPSPEGPWIAGGACLSWFQNQQCSTDIDVYFKNAEQYRDTKDFFLTNLYKYGFSILTNFESENAYTINISDSARRFKVQFIKKFCRSASDLLDNFDITVCQIAWDGKNIFIGKHFIEDLADKRLRFNIFSSSSHKRLVKYMCYGYLPDANTINALLASPSINWDIKGNDHYG